MSELQGTPSKNEKDFHGMLFHKNEQQWSGRRRERGRGASLTFTLGHGVTDGLPKGLTRHHISTLPRRTTVLLSRLAQRCGRP